MTTVLAPGRAPTLDARQLLPRRRQRARVVRLAAAIVAIVAVFATAVTLDVSAREARGAARRLVERRAGELRASRADLRATDAQLAGTRAGVRVNSSSAANQRSANDATTGGIDHTRRTLAETQGELDGLKAALGIQAGQMYTLGTCLHGVGSALGAVAGGANANAVRLLQGAGPSCNRVLAPGGEGAVFPFDFADPFVLRVGSTYYAYATNAGGGAIQVIRSHDLKTWDWLGNALASLPQWAAPNHTWAPSVVARPGMYVAYYTARDAASDRQCVSVAVAKRPEGPFVDWSTAPLVCQLPLLGSIDPSPFVDVDGALYLLWKSDGVDRLWSVPLTPDGLHLAWLPTALLAPDQGWEHDIVEAPTMTVDHGRYYLFYSAGSWNSPDYAVGYAVCATVNGPCSKPRSSPVWSSHGPIAGPGGQEVFTDTFGNRWLAYHAYTGAAVGYPNSRTLHLARLSFAYGRPVIDAP